MMKFTNEQRHDFRCNRVSHAISRSNKELMKSSQLNTWFNFKRTELAVSLKVLCYVYLQPYSIICLIKRTNKYILYSAYSLFQLHTLIILSIFAIHPYIKVEFVICTVT